MVKELIFYGYGIGFVQYLFGGYIDFSCGWKIRRFHGHDFKTSRNTTFLSTRFYNMSPAWTRYSERISKPRKNRSQHLQRKIYEMSQILLFKPELWKYATASRIYGTNHPPHSLFYMSKPCPHLHNVYTKTIFMDTLFL